MRPGVLVVVKVILTVDNVAEIKLELESACSSDDVRLRVMLRIERMRIVIRLWILRWRRKKRSIYSLAVC